MDCDFPTQHSVPRPKFVPDFPGSHRHKSQTLDRVPLLHQLSLHRELRQYPEATPRKPIRYTMSLDSGAGIVRNLHTQLLIRSFIAYLNIP